MSANNESFEPKTISFNKSSKLIQVQDIDPTVEEPVFFANLDLISEIYFKFYVSKKNPKTGKWEEIKLEQPKVILYMNRKESYIHISYESFLKYVAPYIENLNI